MAWARPGTSEQKLESMYCIVLFRSAQGQKPLVYPTLESLKGTEKVTRELLPNSRDCHMMG